MTLIIVLLALLIVGLSTAKLTRGYDLELWATVVSIISCVTLVAIVAVLPLARADVEYKLRSYLSVKMDIEGALLSNKIEDAALRLKVVELNRWLAQKQAENAGIYDVFIPDEITNVTPIRLNYTKASR